jgi:uncharacterized protein DUF6249
MDIDLTPIAIVAIVFVTTAIIVATIFLFIHRSKELRHQTIRMALEKGQPLPPGLLDDAARVKTPGSDLARGVKLAFTGVGLSLFFYLTHRHLWPVGLIVLFIGLGYLAAHALTGRRPPGAPTAG